MSRRIKYFDRRHRNLRIASLKYWRKQAARFKALGLNSRGTTPKKKQHPELDHLHGDDRKAEYQRRRRQNLILAGLTTRGTSRRRSANPYPELNGLAKRDRVKKRQMIWWHRRKQKRQIKALQLMIAGRTSMVAKLKEAA